MDWKQLPRLDPELVEFLKEKYPPVKYQPTRTNDDLVRMLAIQCGHEEVIQAIESIINLQRKGL